MNDLLDRFARGLERTGFALIACGCIGLGLVLFGYLAGWWLLAVALAVAVCFAGLAARSVLRARAVLNAPLRRTDAQRTTRIRGPVAGKVHTERNVRNPARVIDEDGREVGRR